MYRYDGGQQWTFCGDPGGRLGAFIVHNRNLYASVYGQQGFARYDGGTRWTGLGVIPDTTQAYSTVIHQGHIYIGTWPNAKVFRYDGPNQYTDLGQLGREKEVMAMAVYNGKLYAGTLPLGEVYRYDGNQQWTRTGQLDTTPNVLYRRVWSMAVYQGKLFAGTLPSGRVYCLEAGKMASDDRALPPGWRHIAAVKAGDRLKLYVDGKVVSESTVFNPSDYDLSNRQPLRIGTGEHDFFNGKMKDLRIYRQALDDEAVQELCSQQP
jgi:outer membrane protein assembly factor BamB